ncbi:MAG: DinB family protein [Candidatus Promineifilaceae bacterium]
MASITGKLFRVLMVDRSARNKTVASLTQELRSSHQSIVELVTSAENNPTNREQLRHVIGIERWSQKRLQAALGAPLNMDEHDRYCPSAEAALTTLGSEFTQTRQETLTIVEQLTSVPNIATKIIEHNDLGQMTVRSWLQYIDMHGTYELRNVK